TKPIIRDCSAHDAARTCPRCSSRPERLHAFLAAADARNAFRAARSALLFPSLPRARRRPCNARSRGISRMISQNGPLRVGIGGPVGSGKTTLTEKLCKALRDEFSIAVITNDIYTREDALMLARLQALSEDRIMGVETGGCPHTAIREDASINLQASAAMRQ